MRSFWGSLRSFWGFEILLGFHEILLGLFEILLGFHEILLGFHEILWELLEIRTALGPILGSLWAFIWVSLWVFFGGGSLFGGPSHCVSPPAPTARCPGTCWCSPSRWARRWPSLRTNGWITGVFWGGRGGFGVSVGDEEVQKAPNGSGEHRGVPKGTSGGVGGELGVPRRSHWLWGALIGFVVNP